MHSPGQHASLGFRQDVTRSLIDLHVRSAMEEGTLQGLVLNVGGGTKTYRQDCVRIDGNRMLVTDWPGSQTRNDVDVFSDAHELPFDSGVFDCVLCTEVLEHLADPARALSEIHRVLRNGGRAFLTTPFQYQAHQRPFDFFRFTYDGLRLLMSGAGFHDVTIQRRGEALAVALNALKVFAVRVKAPLVLRALRLAERLYLRWYGGRSLEVPLEADPMALGYTIVAWKNGAAQRA